MGKGKKTKTAVYHPPKSGMPYLVVTVSPDGVTVTACASKDEARILASKKTTRAFVEEATTPKPLARGGWPREKRLRNELLGF